MSGGWKGATPGVNVGVNAAAEAFSECSRAFRVSAALPRRDRRPPDEGCARGVTTSTLVIAASLRLPKLSPVVVLPALVPPPPRADSPWEGRFLQGASLIARPRPCIISQASGSISERSRRWALTAIVVCALPLRPRAALARRHPIVRVGLAAGRLPIPAGKRAGCGAIKVRLGLMSWSKSP
jgi:hypothetical protein